MGHLFEEIDSQPSPIGEISLRRRRIPALGDRDIYEVKLGDEFLMSSMFVDAEEALSDLGLARLTTGSDSASLDIVVGGLGLGYTAVAALKDERVREMLVVDYLEPVIRWHKEEKVPLGRTLNRDGRCRYVQGSFFEMALTPEDGFDPDTPGRQFDAILLDIDHSPSDYLNDANARFYTTEKLAAMAQQLKPGGVFALWSNELPDTAFIETLESVFDEVRAEVVRFYNPIQNNEASNSVYTALRPVN
ncbi:spermidine synthase [Marinimicrobium sp. C2-29]|uniref:spermidine synthase n=1 Tax=Marinimicrobium sp. C2-29 TaxID=3139825 RepID=UPI003139BB38